MSDIDLATSRVMDVFGTDVLQDMARYRALVDVLKEFIRQQGYYVTELSHDLYAVIWVNAVDMDNYISTFKVEADAYRCALRRALNGQ